MKIKEIRLELGLRQDQIATTLGITQSYWSKIEKSGAFPDKFAPKIRPFLHLGTLIDTYKKATKSSVCLYSICPVLHLRYCGKLIPLNSLSSLYMSKIEELKKSFLSDSDSIFDHEVDSITSKLARLAEIKNYINYANLIESRQYCICLYVSSPDTNRYFRIEYFSDNFSFLLSGNFENFVAIYLACKFKSVYMLHDAVKVENDYIAYNGTQLFVNTTSISDILNNFFSDNKLELPFLIIPPR